MVSWSSSPGSWSGDGPPAFGHVRLGSGRYLLDVAAKHTMASSAKHETSIVDVITGMLILPKRRYFSSFSRYNSYAAHFMP